MTAQPTPFEVSAPSKSIPHGMRDAILKSLNKDRDKRQASARDFFAELSGGGRMTVTGETGPKAGGSTSTAAMEAAPDFSAHSPAAAVPVYGPAGGHGVPPTAPGVVAAVPPPPAPTRGGQGGGKGLIIGLGAVGLALLVAMAVIAAKSMKPDPNDDIVIAPTNAATPPPTVFAPLIDASDTATPTPTESPSATPDAAATTTPTSKPTGTKPTPTASEKPAGGADTACDACIAAAKSGNVAGAKTNFDRCGDAAKKQLCTKEASRAAPQQIESAAKNGNCGAASVMINAGKAMGIPAARLEKALKGSSCKP
jgi:serine/threonine-protein kinase